MFLLRLRVDSSSKQTKIKPVIQIQNSVFPLIEPSILVLVTTLKRMIARKREVQTN